MNLSSWDWELAISDASVLHTCAVPDRRPFVSVPNSTLHRFRARSGNKEGDLSCRPEVEHIEFGMIERPPRVDWETWCGLEGKAQTRGQPLSINCCNADSREKAIW